MLPPQVFFLSCPPNDAPPITLEHWYKFQQFVLQDLGHRRKLIGRGANDDVPTTDNKIVTARSQGDELTMQRVMHRSKGEVGAKSHYYYARPTKTYCSISAGMRHVRRTCFCGGTTCGQGSRRAGGD